jgi:hypothetical protein
MVVMKNMSLKILISFSVICLGLAFFSKDIARVKNNKPTTQVEIPWKKVTALLVKKNQIVTNMLKSNSKEEFSNLQGYFKVIDAWVQKPEQLNSKEALEVLSHYDTQLSQALVRLPKSSNLEQDLKNLRMVEDQIRSHFAKTKTL